MKRNLSLPLAVCTILGPALATAACHSSGSAAAAGRSSPAGTVTHAAAPVPRVVADCAEAPDTLQVRPKGIVIACADGGLGFAKLTWTRWGAPTATGQGELYENRCEPNCASGKYATYPVLVTLSRVRNSSRGAYFSELTVTWKGHRPPNSTPDSFPLMPPAA